MALSASDINIVFPFPSLSSSKLPVDSIHIPRPTYVFPTRSSITHSRPHSPSSLSFLTFPSFTFPRPPILLTNPKPRPHPSNVPKPTSPPSRPKTPPSPNLNLERVVKRAFHLTHYIIKKKTSIHTASVPTLSPHCHLPAKRKEARKKSRTT